MAGTEAGFAEPSSLSSDLPLSFATSESSTAEFTDSNGTVRVEAITMSTLHGMLARVLEQTNALWQAQASTNHILYELRQSIPAPREKAVNLNPPVMSTQETTHHTDAILRATDERYPTSGPSVRVHNDETPAIIPPFDLIDQLTADPVISPGQIGLPEPERGSALTTMSLPATIEEDGDQPLGVPDHHVSLMSRAYAPSGLVNISSQDSLHAHQKQLEAGLEPSIPSRDRDEASTVDPIQSTTQDPTHKRAFDPPDVIQGERKKMVCARGPFAAERENESAHKDCELRIASPVGGLAHTRVELDNKRQVSFAAEKVPQVAVGERDEALHNQLAELADLIRRMLALYEEKKVLMEQQWTEGLKWKEDCGRQIRELKGMASWLVDDRAAARRREEQADEDNPSESNPKSGTTTLPTPRIGIHQVIDEIRKMDVEYREVLQTFSDTWKTDSERRNEEIISAVRATASEQVPFNVQGYLDEFSKALSTEVRMLLGEVGKLREERRSIQYELGDLLMMQSTLGPDWPPEYSSPHAWPSPAGIPLPESPHPRPGWRAVSLRGNRRTPRPEPPPAPERQVHSWATWLPNPLLAPTPPSVEPALLPDRGSPGLFGPRTPPLDSSRRDSLAARPEPPPAPVRRVHPRVTWQPNPLLTLTPPSVEPALLVLDRGSPGLFGPRSPYDSPRISPREIEEPDSPNSTARSWATCQPNPALARTSPSIEPTVKLE